MAENSNIEWTDHTFNPWIGCTKVSPGCANCYAATQDNFRKWTPEGWGKGKPRKRTSDANWRLPLKWNRQAESRGIAAACCQQPYTRPRVFCASLADWLDDEVPVEWLVNLLETIHATPNLDWLLLTKRPENWQTRMNEVFQFGELRTQRHVDFINWVGAWSQAAGDEVPPHNVWIGTTIEDGPRKDRLPLLRRIPAKVRFLSCEPLLADIGFIMLREKIHWVICGGESGPGCRPMDIEWARSLRDQCTAERIPFFMKQLGGVRDHRGKLEDLPEDLRIREFPTPIHP